MTRYLIVIFMLLLGCVVNKATFLTETSILEDVTIQPKEALEIATPHLSEHGTFLWQDEKNLKTHIIRKGKYYFIKRSDFPAKSANWYLNTCIRIDSKSGEMTFLD